MTGLSISIFSVALALVLAAYILRTPLDAIGNIGDHARVGLDHVAVVLGRSTNAWQCLAHQLPELVGVLGRQADALQNSANAAHRLADTESGKRADVAELQARIIRMAEASGMLPPEPPQPAGFTLHLRQDSGNVVELSPKDQAAILDALGVSRAAG